MQKKHKLRDVSMDDAASWPFADATFAVEFDNINNVTKLRQVPQHVAASSVLHREPCESRWRIAYFSCFRLRLHLPQHPLDAGRAARLFPCVAMCPRLWSCGGHL